MSQKYVILSLIFGILIGGSAVFIHFSSMLNNLNNERFWEVFNLQNDVEELTTLSIEAKKETESLKAENSRISSELASNLEILDEYNETITVFESEADILENQILTINETLQDYENQISELRASIGVFHQFRDVYKSPIYWDSSEGYYYHEQVSADSCASACVQMVLDAYQVSDLPSQETLAYEMNTTLDEGTLSSYLRYPFINRDISVLYYTYDTDPDVDKYLSWLKGNVSMGRSVIVLMNNRKGGIIAL